MKIIRIIFIICFLICLGCVLRLIKAPETNLADAFFSASNNENYLSKLSKISNNRLNIIIESENKEKNEEIKNTIEEKLSELNKDNKIIQDIIKVYRDYPANFLTSDTRKLLTKQDYKTIEKNSLQMLYSPLGIYIAPPDKDPYLFATSYAMSNQKYLLQEAINKDGKIYSLISYECRNNKDIKVIKKFTEELNAQTSSKIYLSGTPIHSFETQHRSNLEINIFCVLSVLMLLLLCKSYFGSVKIILPIALSIFFGFLFGFTSSTLIFKKLHILTFVFSTSLIGISLDYSLHYFLSGKELSFKKSLLTSLLSTIITFGVLYFSGIEVLKQISVFVSFGLLGVYLFVRLFLPLFNIQFNFSYPQFYNTDKYKKIILSMVILLIIYGGFSIKFEDNIKNLYNPSEKLMQAEIIYKNIFNYNSLNFIIVKGNNTDEIIEQEEKISDKLAEENIKSLALSNFISSTNRQKENIKLVKTLYKNRLNQYANFLDRNKKEKITETFNLYSVEVFPLNSKFLIDKNTSFIMLFSDTKNYKSVNIANEMNNILKNFRHKCILFIPVIFILLLLVLKLFYSIKQTIRIILPSFLGGVSALCIVCIFCNLNVFHLLAFILSLGFSMDYSIFRIQGGRSSNSAILISAASTIFSFLLLSLTGFKLISSLGIVLSLGIFISYLLSLILIEQKEEIEKT